MFRKLRSCVQIYWVLVVIVIFSGYSFQASQFWNSEPALFAHEFVTFWNPGGIKNISVDHRTVIEQSCEVESEMAPNLTDEQNRILKGAYKFGRKVVHFESHVRFLRQVMIISFLYGSISLVSVLC